LGRTAIRNGKTTVNLALLLANGRPDSEDAPQKESLMQRSDNCRKCKAAFIVIVDPNGSDDQKLVVLYCPNCGERFTMDIPAGYNSSTVTIISA
jgi:transcription elongation factor Elf1